MSALAAVLQGQLARPETSWSIGIFGAVAEFHRDAGETVQFDDLGISTSRGGIRLRPVPCVQRVRYALRSARVRGLSPGVALCLPEGQARLPSHASVTEVGPDRDAIRREDRDAILFDLGLDTPYGRFCVRTNDETLLRRLREAAGHSIFASSHRLYEELVESSPHRVSMSRLGRIEVYQPIPGPEGVTPSGPHTHLRAKLARLGRTHDANIQLPPGLVPCAMYHTTEADPS